MVSQELTYLTLLFFKHSNAGDAVISLGSLIALQCFTVYIMSNPNALTFSLCLRNARISCLKQNFHGEQIVSSLILAACESCYHLEIIESYNILAHMGPLGIIFSNLLLIRRAKCQVSTRP